MSAAARGITLSFAEALPGSYHVWTDAQLNGDRCRVRHSQAASVTDALPMSMDAAMKAQRVVPGRII